MQKKERLFQEKVFWHTDRDTDSLYLSLAGWEGGAPGKGGGICPAYAECRGKCVWIPEKFPLLPGLTVEDYLSFPGVLSGEVPCKPGEPAHWIWKKRSVRVQFLSRLEWFDRVFGTKEDVAAEEAVKAENAAFLYIDDTTIYEGMDQTYEQGYVPDDADGAVHIVLPLRQSRDADIPYIIVTPDLGGTEGNPFLLKNYQKTVCKTEDGVFFVYFDFLLAEKYENGIYSVTFCVDYDVEGSRQEQEFTIYIKLDDGLEAGQNDSEPENGTKTQDTMEDDTSPDASEDLSGAAGNNGTELDSGGQEEAASPEPKIIVESVKGLEEELFSGSDITLQVTLKNTSKTKYVQNMTVVIHCETEGISLIADSNMLYYDRLDQDSALTLPVHLNIDAGMVDPEGDSEQARYGLTSGNLILIYEDEEGDEYEETVDIFLSIAPLEQSGLEMAEETKLGIGKQMAISILVLCAVMAAVFLSFFKAYKKRKAGNGR